MKDDYYHVLGVERSADQDDIKKAYRRLAMKYHPDRKPGDKEAEAKFKDIQEAYKVLSTPENRAAYDQYGHAGVHAQAGGGGPGAGNFNDIFETIFGDFGDIFGQGRGRPGAGQSRVQPGADLRYNMELSLEDAVFGTTLQIQVPVLTACDVCKGSGAKAGSKPASCQDCDGHGQVRIQQGFFTVQQTCPTCRGSGQVITDPCTSCRGQGRVKKTKKLSVKVPAGVDTGDRIRLAGEGEAGLQGGPAGDLYVHVRVIPHEIFAREDENLLCEVPISFVDAALGGQLEIPTLEGRVKLKIPPETQSGRVFRIRGKGVKPVRGHHRGDLFCRVVVETPVKLTKEQANVLKQFNQTVNENAAKHRPKSHHWFEGVKKFFEGKFDE